MTAEERDADVAWTLRMAAREEACEVFDVRAGRVFALARMFPVPKTEGMTPEQQEAALDAWRAEVRAYMDADRTGHAVPTPARPPAPSHAPEVPAT